MRLSIPCSKYLVLGGAAAAVLLSAAAPAYAWEEIQWAGQTISGDPWTSKTPISEANGTTGPNGTVLTWTTSSIDVWDTIYFNGATTTTTRSGGKTVTTTTYDPKLWASVTLSLASADLETIGTGIHKKSYTAWTFDYSIFNASSEPSPGALVTEFDFDVDGLVHSAKIDGSGAMNHITASSTLTHGADTVFLTDDSVWGYTTGGIGQGKTGTGEFTILLPNSITEFSLTDPVVDFLNGTRGSAFADCGQSEVTGRPVGWVPEPGTWALMLTGFFGLGLALRRRQQGMSPLAA